MPTNEYELTVTAFESEEAYKQYQDTSKALDAFCTSVNFLDTVITNKAFDLVVDFCGETGDIQNSVKIFSPVLQEGQSQREIFIEVGGKVVETITQSAFEAGGARAGQIISTAVFATGSIATTGLASAPAFIMGATTGGAVYLAGKYIGIPMGEAVGEYSKEYWGKVYDNYLKQSDNLIRKNLDIINTEINEKTTYGIDDTNTLTPEYQIDLTTQDVIPLSEGQTVSDIAKLTNKSSVNLLEYTLDEAKYLPVGEPIKIYEGEPTVVTSENGNIKLFENPDGSTTAILPTQDNITYSSENDVLIHGDYTNPDSISFTANGVFEVWQKDSNGNMYQSQVSTDDFTLNYNSNNGVKELSDISITSDNVSLDDIANLTPYSKEDLQAFNFLDSNTIDSNTNFGLLVLKVVLANNRFYGKSKLA